MSKKLLQFFPGPRALVWTIDGKAVLVAAAWGGEAPVKGVDYPDMAPQKTTPGRYVVWSYAPYTTRTWMWSGLPWGTRIKGNPINLSEVLYETGSLRHPWRPITDKIPKMTRVAILDQYYKLYGRSRRYDPDGDGFPETWVFNDFGPMAVRYFRDKNGNKKLDGDESLSGEMIHTTPPNEASLVTKGVNSALMPSHGCIHVHPTMRDKFHAAGAFARGTDFLIHDYDKDIPTSLRVAVTPESR